MYKLEFDSHNEIDKRRFEFLYDGFIIGGSLPTTSNKGIHILRREISILDKLEAISKVCECGKEIIKDNPKRELISSSNPLLVDLEDNEYDLLFNYVASVPWNSGITARYALDTLDWIRSCK